MYANLKNKYNQTAKYLENILSESKSRCWMVLEIYWGNMQYKHIKWNFNTFVSLYKFNMRPN